MVIQANSLRSFINKEKILYYKEKSSSNKNIKSLCQLQVMTGTTRNSEDGGPPCWKGGTI